MANAYSFHRPVENSYLERERDRRLTRELVAVMAAVLVLGGGLLAYTWVHIEVLRTGYRIEALQREQHLLEQEERRWRLEASYRIHPRRIEERAEKELGMAPPTMDQTLFFAELKAQN